MRLTKPFAASIFAVFLSVSGHAFDLRFEDSKSVLGLATAYSISKPAYTSVTITGRVKTPEGRPIKAALVVLMDADTHQVVRNTYSSSFGYYRLEQVEAGKLYVLSVSHKRYLFAFPAQLLEINEDRSGVDFTGENNE